MVLVADQDHHQRTLASKGFLVGDTDEFDDAPNGGAFKGPLVAMLIDLTGIAPGSVKLEVFGLRTTGSTRTGFCRPSTRRRMTQPPAERVEETPPRTRAIGFAQACCGRPSTCELC